MKSLINIFIITCLPLLFAASTSIEKTQYCNARFTYCLNYPADQFTNFTTSPNGDGITMMSLSNEVYLSVAGSHNVMDWTLEDIYYFTFEDFEMNNEKAENVESVFDEDFSINVFETATQYIYYKTYLLDEKYVTVRLSAALAYRDEVEFLRDKIDLTVNI